MENNSRHISKYVYFFQKKYRNLTRNAQYKDDKRITNENQQYTCVLKVKYKTTVQVSFIY